MLVLSRRQQEKIAFPTLGVTVEVLRVAGKTVRVGIDAPSDLLVLRHEVLDDPSQQVRRNPAPSAASSQLPAPPTPEQRKKEHRVRNRLNTVGLALRVLEKQLERGMVADVEQTLKLALKELCELEALHATGPPERQEAKRHPQALVVEDDANESYLLAGYLRLSGYDVQTANDGQEALDVLAQGARPDVVLLDMWMPRCNGPETISVIRSNPNFRGLRVYGVSGSAPSEIGVTTGPQGVDRWFAKPVDPAELVEVMNRELEQYV